MAKAKAEKYIPKVGDKLYLCQRTGDEWVDMVKRPYTVIEVSSTKVKIQSCKLIFNGPAYYNTIADDIQEDTNGRIEELHWFPSKGYWANDEYKTGYPVIAVFGEWKHQPYLN